MKHELNIWVVGGDQRQARLAQLLSQDGHTVYTYALDLVQDLSGPIPQSNPLSIPLADCVILPLPVSQGEGLLNAPPSPAVQDRCRRERPPETSPEPGRKVRCFRYV